jgi:hypothetical protein
MTHRQALGRSASPLVISAIISVLTLGACHPNTQQAASSSAPAPLAALPLATSGAPPIAPAPAAAALPPAAPANVGRLADPGDRYAFADQAYAMTSAFGDAPPDYTFDYGEGERPWVWRGDDQSMRVAEPLPGGGYRYYYYEPGQQTPYLVRDRDYSYGYRDGALVVVYDSRGRALSQDDAVRQAELAGRFLARAQALYAASQRNQREAVAEANWAARRSQIDAQRAQWAADQADDQDWRAYHAAHEQQEDQQWDAEQYRREAQAARFAEAINDAQLAAQDWQAAQRAQAHAAAAGPAQPQSAAHPALGFGQQPHSAAPPLQAQVQAPVQPQPQPGPNLAVQPTHEHRPPPSSGAPLRQPEGPTAPPIAGQNAAAQADALRHAQDQARAQTASRQAQLDAQHQAQLAAQASAHAQAAALAAEHARQIARPAPATVTAEVHHGAPAKVTPPSSGAPAAGTHPPHGHHAESGAPPANPENK